MTRIYGESYTALWLDTRHRNYSGRTPRQVIAAGESGRLWLMIRTIDPHGSYPPS